MEWLVPSKKCIWIGGQLLLVLMSSKGTIGAPAVTGCDSIDHKQGGGPQQGLERKT